MNSAVCPVDFSPDECTDPLTPVVRAGEPRARSRARLANCDCDALNYIPLRAHRDRRTRGASMSKGPADTVPESDVAEPQVAGSAVVLGVARLGARSVVAQGA